jgi:tetraacyldisaccharide 4'-kinase
MTRFLYKLATDQYRGLLFWPAKGILYALSLIYGLVISCLRAIYHLRPYSLGAKVISVGNLTLGGTGKTPLVEYIARNLTQEGKKVAILTRGYQTKRPQSGLGPLMADEPLMLQRNLEGVPVIVNPHRQAAAQEARARHSADTLLLDDGLQQWGVQKDLEIVLIDATCPFGNKQLLPRGILREPLSALRQADILVLTKTNLVSDTKSLKNYLRKINPAALLLESRHQPVIFYALGNREETLPLQELETRKVALLSAIADPASFEGLIKRLGISIALSLRFPDHYHYSQQDIAAIAAQCWQKYVDLVITTEKDAARLSPALVKECGLRIIVLRMELEFVENEERFMQRLLGIYRA